MRWSLLLILAACTKEQSSPHTEVIAPAATAEPTSEASEPAPPPIHKKHHGKGSDRDGDGVPDNVDKCPDDPEDLDGYEDADGCPDPDNDQDGVLDIDDKCPNNPGPAANGGCP